MRVLALVLVAGCLGFTPHTDRRAAFVNLGIMDVGVATFLAGAYLASRPAPEGDPRTAATVTIDTGAAIVGASVVGMIANLVTAAVIGIPRD